MNEAADWGVRALRARARRGLTCTTARAHLLRLRHQGQHRLEGRRWASEWRQYEQVFPALAASSASTRSASSASTRTCRPNLMALLDGKDVMVGVIDVASDHGRDARRGGRHHRPRAAVRAARAADRLHQLRPGADGPARSQRRKTRGARAQARRAGAAPATAAKACFGTQPCGRGGKAPSTSAGARASVSLIVAQRLEGHHAFWIRCAVRPAGPTSDMRHEGLRAPRRGGPSWRTRHRP